MEERTMKQIMNRIFIHLIIISISTILFVENAFAQGYQELYNSGEFSSLSAFGYTQNKEFTLESKSWTASVAQVNSNVFYLGCNSSNASKGILNNNNTFSDIVAALRAEDATYNSNYATAHAYALLFNNAYSNVTKATFTWNGGNNAFQVYLFGDSGSGYELLESTNYATSGAAVSGSVEWSGDATNYTKFAIVARPGATNSTATNKTLRPASFIVYKTNAAPSTYTLSYDANGGTGTLTDPNSPYAANATVTVLANSFTRDGYTFSNWNTADNGSGAEYGPNDTFTISANTTLYAQWTSNAAATTTAIDDSGITNTDVYTSTTAGSLSASVTLTSGGSDVPGSVVTWSGNNDAVATIHPTTGAVTLVGVGSVTFTANYAGETGVYQSSFDTYEMTVTSSEPYVQPTEIEANLNDSFFGTNYGGTASGITDDNPISGAIDNVTITYAGSGNHYINASQIRFYPNNKLTIEAPSGYDIKSIVFTSAGTWAATITANCGTYTSGTKTWTGTASSVLFTGSGSSRCDMSKATVNLAVHSSAVATTTTIDESGITNTDVYNSPTAGSLSASVKDDGDNIIVGAIVTWSGNNDAVATIDPDTGAITLVSAGSVTFTASYAGVDNTYLE